MISSEGIVCFIAFRDSENIRFGEMILFLSQLIMAILNFAWEECFDTNLRTPSKFVLFCSLF